MLSYLIGTVINLMNSLSPRALLKDEKRRYISSYADV